MWVETPMMTPTFDSPDNVCGLSTQNRRVRHRCTNDPVWWSASVLALVCSVVVGAIVSVNVANAGPVPLSVVDTELAQCPPDPIVWPCTCTLSSIYCYHSGIVQVRPILERVSAYLGSLPTTSTRHFVQLELDGLSLVRLQPNFTAGLSFERVALKNLRSLRAIHRRAFVATERRLQQLSLEGDSSHFVTESRFGQLNAVIESMPALTGLYLDAYHLTTVGRHCLTHNGLTDLSFNYNRVRKGVIAAVAAEAFYYLPSVRTIDLYNQSIDALGRDSLRFQADSDQLTTAVFLQDNRLRADSFEVGVFSHIRRALRLDLSYNNVTYVDRAVFEPYFAANAANRILLGDQLRLDCHNRWIATLDSRYNQIVTGMVQPDEPDHDRRVLVTLDPGDYDALHCRRT